MSIGSNIRRFRLSKDMTQEELGAVVGVSSMAVSQWENDRAVPRMGAVQMLAECFGVPVSEVINDDESTSDYTDVPLYGSIAAGTPIEMVAYDNTYPVPSKVRARYPDGFLLKVDGESMNRVLPNGCYAYVAPSEVVDKPMKPYAVCVNGYDATIKRVRALNNGFELVPDSSDPTYKPEVFDYGIEDTPEITVIGRVVWYCVPFDWEF